MVTSYNSKSLIVFYCWGIWRCRNSSIFQNVTPNHHSLCNWILKCYGMYGDFHTASKGVTVIEPLTDLLFPVGFFDDAAQGHLGGVRCHIWRTQSHFIDLWIGIENCSNNCAEIIALCLCLFWARYLHITDIRIFGDSRVIIDWFNHKSMIHTLLLQHWCRTIRDILPHFSCVTVSHTYRENNEDAERLSKKAFGGPRGHLFFYETRGTTIIRTGQMKLF